MKIFFSSRTNDKKDKSSILLKKRLKNAETDERIIGDTKSDQIKGLIWLDKHGSGTRFLGKNKLLPRIEPSQALI